jgi:hypothetical protein
VSCVHPNKTTPIYKKIIWNEVRQYELLQKLCLITRSWGKASELCSSSYGPFWFFCLLWTVLNRLTRCKFRLSSDLIQLFFCYYSTLMFPVYTTASQCEYHLTKSICSLLSPLLIHQGRQKTKQCSYTEIIFMFTLCIIPFISSTFSIILFYYNVKNYNFSYHFVWVWNLSLTSKNEEIEDVWE